MDKQNAVFPHNGTTWMKLDYIMLTLRRDMQKITYYIIPFILNGQNGKINRAKVD